MPFVLAAFGIMSAARAEAQEITLPVASNEATFLEVIIVSTEFKYVPAKIDNSTAETEHGIVLPAFNFRLEVKAGEIARKSILIDMPGENEFSCDLPGHREAGMKGTLIAF
jgi:uncharacterized cupredoxin-like copper-binding protein